MKFSMQEKDGRYNLSKDGALGLPMFSNLPDDF